ncbi:RNA polymerase sigma factor [Lysobacter sp. TY2-98]|uniref:RNA polymerase sigma factor n=1 Tax=Lysobacter sp. TY2-98 TaxID=2290922 RepID=UPI000E1FC650|nr:RNA polymerase sigma factor [Lysobacter sp. TY2-98]AXK71305.1 RNA polymerase sigma factor [Lysobacter sp. TY2-98]
MTNDAARQLDTLWRMESPRLVARVARMTGDVGVAEEIVQDVLVQALQRWPVDGVPDNPAAWLMTAARHRAVDHLRQRSLHGERQREYAVELDVHDTSRDGGPDMAADDDIGDDLLRLMFVACHPVLPLDARVALTLRLLGGLTVEEIARAFLTRDATISQRIVRAKQKLRDAQVPFEVPRREELPERLDAVLQVLYLVFNEGYSATAGDDLVRPALCEDAMRLGRVLAGLMPDEAEVHGLVALMELQASRLNARTDPDGNAILLADQDRGRWDRTLILHGLAELDRAVALGGADGPYALQAAIAACHARAPSTEATDWARIAALYAQLSDVTASPVVELNRAVAESMAFGPEHALPRVDRLIEEGALGEYALLPAVRADLLDRLGRADEARIDFERAAALTRNVRERRVLLDRAARCGAA